MREIPPVKSSGSERRCSHCRPGPGPSLPSALFAHSTSRLPGESCSQCAQAGCRQLLLHGTHSLRAFLELAGSLTYGDDVLGFFFFYRSQRTSLLLSCYKVVEGKDTGEICCLFWRCVLGFPQLRDTQFNFCGPLVLGLLYWST